MAAYLYNLTVKFKTFEKDLEWGKHSTLKGYEIIAFQIMRINNPSGPLLFHSTSGGLHLAHGRTF